MRDEKLKEFTSILEHRQNISFYLYNVRYNIEIKNGNFILSNNGSSCISSYSTITDLFTKYRVYGSSLAECFEDIVICKNN